MSINYYGNIQINSDKIRVTDPCYDKESNVCYIIDNIVPGSWKATAIIKDTGMWGKRVHTLTIRNVDSYTAVLKLSKIHEVVGVDSGQAGFFVEEFYPNTQEEGESFYDKACSLTCSNDKGGIINDGTKDIGVVSRSGYGDGLYDLVLTKGEDGKVYGATIIFISEDD